MSVPPEKVERLVSVPGHPVTEDLPPSLFREIGRVIVGFARLEYQLSQAIYVVLRLDRQSGRLAIREPRATDRLSLLLDLLQQRGVSFATDTDALEASLAASQRERNQLAHGVWGLSPIDGQPALSITHGQWRPFGTRERVRRILVPESIPFTVSDCRRTLGEIHKCMDLLGVLMDEVISLLPPPSSLQTPIERSRPLSRSRDQPLSKQKHPRESSPAKPKPKKLSSAQKRALREKGDES